eukprot:gnl/Trimastix_PCT/1918.p3 GENE.gnl/Trimastix_PCT/1918~~gnl/Trimastix_PCT/1918.p3  ORF type:complete len:146 (+),score=20.87 gnl/Trimastix_PCT/1918:74-511(+)
MHIINFTPVASLSGGLLIGAATAAMLLFNGKLAGVSGIFRGVIEPSKGDWLWRALFISGLLTAGFIMKAMGHPNLMKPLDILPFPSTLVKLAIAGFLVGIGVRLGNGCTSGHGICGLARRSPRSVVATGTFMLFGMITTLYFRAY